MAAVSKRDSMDATKNDLRAKVDANTLDTTATSSKRPLGLIDLPPSVRNNIYKHVLDTELVNVGKPNVSYKHALKDEVLHFSASRPPFPVNTALFYVNKEVSGDALRYFYSKNLFVRFEIYTPDARHAKNMLENSGLLFATPSLDLLAQSMQHALDVVLVEKKSSQKRVAVVFPAQYLPRLVNYLDEASHATATWAPAHSLAIKVVNTYNLPVSQLQGDLLEGFRLLTNLGRVIVDSANVLPRYTEGLQQDMTSARFTAEGWLGSVTELADLGDSARETGEYAVAHEYGQAVVIALTYGYLTHAEALHEQDEAFATRVQRLRWRTEVGIGIALALQHRTLTAAKTWLDKASPDSKMAARDLLLAEASVSKALNLATDSPSPASNPWFLSLPVEFIPPNKSAWFTDCERAQTWFALGTVHTALGEHIFGAGDLERALELWDSGDDQGRERVEMAFERAREGIDGDAERMWVGKVKPGSGLKRAARLARANLTGPTGPQ